jgi:multidrug resistance efflux pump
LAAAALLLLAAGIWLMRENGRLRSQINQAEAERTEVEQRHRELQAQLAEQRSLASANAKVAADLRENLDRIKQGSTGSLSRSELPTIVAFALAPQTRGISPIATVSVPADTDYVAMELQLESGNYPAYRATLKAVQENQVIWRSGRLKARSNGDIKVVGVSLPSSLLQWSRYLVEVSGIAADGSSEIVGSYAFRITKQ